MASGLPHRVDPLELAERGVRLVGTLPLGALARLGELLLNHEGNVALDLDFGRDAQGRRCLRGHVDCEVSALCQRCLQPMRARLAADIDVLLLAPGQAPAEEGGEVLELASVPVALAELVEDELLLAAPMTFLHPAGQCEAPAALETPAEGAAAAGDVGEAGERKNPFAVLERLKKHPPSTEN